MNINQDFNRISGKIKGEIRKIYGDLQGHFDKYIRITYRTLIFKKNMHYTLTILF